MFVQRTIAKVLTGAHSIELYTGTPHMFFQRTIARVLTGTRWHVG